MQRYSYPLKVFFLCLGLAVAMGALSSSARAQSNVVACPVMPSFHHGIWSR